MTPSEVGELLMVSPTTIRQWSAEGKIPSLVTPGGHRRFLRSDIEKFSRERGLKLHIPSHNDVLRVLIVDDNQSIVQFLTRLFELLEDLVETEIADSGFDAGHLVNSFRPHVVLLDVMMPGMDGFEVCRFIKQDPVFASTRVIAMTGYYDEMNVKKMLDAGAECCLAKPIKIDTLMEAIGLDIDILRKKQADIQN